jgi:murein DD-endopeptidase MepM/ murein hydrolase activator NlpD
MTQRKKIAHKNLHKSWHQSLPAQSLVWLSSLSLLSSGFVLAQTESAIDNIVPSGENTQTSGNAVRNITIERAPAVSSSESAPVEFSTRRTRLKQRLNRNVATQSSEPVRKGRAQSETSQPVRNPLRNSENETSSTAVRRLRVRVAKTRPVIIPEVRVEKAQVEVSSQPRVTTREEKPQVDTAPQNLRDKLRSTPQEAVQSSTTAENTKDYNNAYIDPTDYNSRTIGKYEAPNSVVLSGRSGSCRTIGGQNLTACLKAPVTVSTSKTERTRATAPSWIKKSRSIEVAATIPVRQTPTKRENTSGWRGSRVAALSNVENVRVTQRTSRTESSPRGQLVASKSNYHPNRFIPAPSNFVPQAPTTVSAAPVAPSGGSLPMPMNSVNSLPRPSTVAYNIPLESTLPRVAYAGGGIAYNPTGLIFPLSIPAPITSIFGWRSHPITGDRRFHSGTDIGAATGTPVIAAYTGQVEVADNVGGYGLTVILNHNNALQTLYGHMSQLYVQPGQWVQQGTLIGLVGSTGNSTGPHLHFEVRQLTQEGWVATDPGMNLQYAMTQLMQSLQTAQVPREGVGSRE